MQDLRSTTAEVPSQVRSRQSSLSLLVSRIVDGYTLRCLVWDREIEKVLDLIRERPDTLDSVTAMFNGSSRQIRRNAGVILEKVANDQLLRPLLTAQLPILVDALIGRLDIELVQSILLTYAKNSGDLGSVEERLRIYLYICPLNDFVAKLLMEWRKSIGDSRIDAPYFAGLVARGGGTKTAVERAFGVWVPEYHEPQPGEIYPDD